MAEGATPEEIDAAEAALGVTFPPELRVLLEATAGREAWYGACFLMIYSVESLVGVNREIERHDGFLAFASDGSRELVGFDTRRHPAPVVMIDISSAGWAEALFQAASLEEFLQQRERGEDFRWDDPYRSHGGA